MDYKTFFDTVNGKKIRWTQWNKNSYFIPKKLKNDILIGYDSDYVSKDAQWQVVNGFNFNDQGDRWEYFIDINKELENV